MSNNTNDLKEITKIALELLFSSNISIDEKKSKITQYINPNKYIQHSPTLANGLGALMALVESFDQQFDAYSIEVKRLVGEDDLVVAHCHYKLGVTDKRGKAIVEIFKFEDGKMVEHWDVIQDVPATDANGNGMF